MRILLDKLCMDILDFMDDHPDVEKGNFHAEIYSIADGLSVEPTIIRAAVKYLKEKKFIEYVYSRHGTLLGFRLTHMGVHRDEFARLKLLDQLAKCFSKPTRKKHPLL